MSIWVTEIAMVRKNKIQTIIALSTIQKWLHVHHSNDFFMGEIKVTEEIPREL